MSVKVLTAAILYVNTGLSVIPIRPDGSKAPAIKRWKPYQNRRPDNTEITQWFDNSYGYGLAIICGAVSGNLEILDCDAPQLFSLWCEIVERLSPGLVSRLILIQTPSGGWHAYYRCVEIDGSLKLAQRREDSSKKIKTLFETRGEGGYALVPPSPPECHPENKPYTLVSGDLTAIPTITPAERAVLLDAARSFNEYVKQARVIEYRPKKRKAAQGNRPGDDYNGRGDWLSLLTRHGWKYVANRGEISLWRRPGKTGPGISATTNFAASNLLYVFSTNADPFEDRTAYSLFSAYSLLEHSGDFHSAAQALVAQGYGKQKASKRKRVLKAPAITSLRRPAHTQVLSQPIRPKATLQLPMPVRPHITNKLGPEVAL